MATLNNRSGLAKPLDYSGVGLSSGLDQWTSLVIFASLVLGGFRLASNALVFWPESLNGQAFRDLLSTAKLYYLLSLAEPASLIACAALVKTCPSRIRLVFLGGLVFSLAVVFVRISFYALLWPEGEALVFQITHVWGILVRDRPEIPVLWYLIVILHGQLWNWGRRRMSPPG